MQEAYNGEHWLLCSITDDDTGWRRDLISLRIEQSYSEGKPHFLKVSTGGGLHYQHKTKVYRYLKTKKFSYGKIAEHIKGLLDRHDEQQARYDAGAKVALGRIKEFEQFINSDPKMAALNVQVTTQSYENDEEGSVEVYVNCNEDSFDGDDEPVSVEGTYDGEKVSGSITFDGLGLEQLVALIAVARADQFGVLDMLTLGDDSVLGPIIDKMTKSPDGSVGAA